MHINTYRYTCIHTYIYNYICVNTYRLQITTDVYPMSAHTRIVALLIKPFTRLLVGCPKLGGGNSCWLFYGEAQAYLAVILGGNNR